MIQYGPDIEHFLRIMEANCGVDRTYLEKANLLSFVVDRNNIMEVGKAILFVSRKNDFVDETHKKNYFLKALRNQIDLKSK